MKKEDILTRLEQIRSQIIEATHRAGRDEEDITLVAVSKHQPIEYVQWAIEAGQKVFGENYIQEALDKVEKLKEHKQKIQFHFIGRCQSNKAKYVPGNFSMVHSVDSIKFVKELDKRCAHLGIGLDILVQVNVAKEETKGGVLEQDLFKFVEDILDLTNNLELMGLMCMPPYFEDPERVRPYFATLRRLKESLEQKLGIDLPHLSMGMSSDFKQAILEGATLVRIGTNIFGPREY